MEENQCETNDKREPNRHNANLSSSFVTYQCGETAKEMLES